MCQPADVPTVGDQVLLCPISDESGSASGCDVWLGKSPPELVSLVTLNELMNELTSVDCQ
jgi:hypothetical protein